MPALETNAARILPAVERAIAELRRGAAVIIQRGEGHAALIQASETASPQALGNLRLIGNAEPCLLLTARRAAAIGIKEAAPLIDTTEVIAFALDDMSPDAVSYLADPVHDPLGINLRHDNFLTTDVPEVLARNAVALAKLSSLLPAALFVNLPDNSCDQIAKEHNLLMVSAEDIASYRSTAAYSLKKVASARIPLEVAEKTTVVAFRPREGGVEHLALIIGDPEAGKPALVRLHSECFTGDLLGSLRCDCGDQLRGAIKLMDETGGGILLYLSQEGRGIGLMNKLRAYELQDRGADTSDANELVGFDPDERIYTPAAEMLRQLGFNEVRLLTNNPEKVTALVESGIEVVETVPHHFPSNGHNDFYLKTKALRFGHTL
ncbi:GTP cyclohydrolase II [Kiloniella laminariae]|uniref:GTP cyclohydrolase II n=1 Tax=Kiloniella laminariae TaxID=454162 RepID=UPI000360D459|nr:GTP cyclohydrolase II [Kiloniella laminariae]